MRNFIIIALISIAGLCMQAQSFEPKWVGEVIVLQGLADADTVAVPTEKAIARIKTSASAGLILTGIGNVTTKVSIKEGWSTTQIDSNEPIYLVVRCKDNDIDPSTFIQVVKFEEKKRERKAELAKQNWLGNVTEGNLRYVPYEADRYGKNSYILKIQPIEGEFGVRVLNPEDVDEKANLFYCFGAHPMHRK